MQGFKKVLVALLVVMTILGTMGPVFAAPKDVQGTKYEDAAVRLMALGIFKGDDKGNFNPDMPITRAEATAIIIRALGLEKSAELMKGVTKFADVNADPGLQWATGAINIAVSQGIIKGYPDGRFGGRDNVTYAQLAKMILYALNYGITVEGGVWPTAVLAKADELGILDGLSVVADAPIVRGEAAKMLDNSLDVKSLKQTGYGSLTYYEETGQTLLEKLGLDEIEGRVVEIPAVNNALDDDEVVIGDKTYTALQGVDVVSLFGLEVKAWVNDDDEIVFVEKKTADKDVYTDTVDAAPVGKDVKLHVLDDNVTFADDAVVYINNSKAKVSDLKAGDYGRFVKEKNKIAFAYVFRFTNNGVATGVSGETVKYFGLDDTERKLELGKADGYYVYNPDFSVTTIDSIKKDSVLTWWKDSDDIYYVMVVNKQVTGTLQKASYSGTSGKFRINGKDYDTGSPVTWSDNDDEDVAVYDDAGDVENLLNENVVALLDLKGHVRHIRGDSAGLSGTIYGVVVDAYRSGSKYIVRVFTKDGQEVEYAFEKRADWTTAGLDGFTGLKPAQFKLNADGEIAEGTFDWVDKTENLVTISKFDDKDDYFLAGAGRYYVNDSTILMNIDVGADEDPELVNWKDIEGSGTVSGTLKAYVVGDVGRDAKFVVFKTGYNLIASEDYFYGVVTSAPMLVGSSKWEIEVDVFGEGARSYVLASADDKDKISKGDVIAFQLTADGKVKSKFNAEGKSGRESDAEGLRSAYEFVSAAVYKFESGRKYVAFAGGESTYYRLAADAVVYDLNSKGNLGDKIAAADLDEGDVVVAVVDVEANEVRAVLVKAYAEDTTPVAPPEAEAMGVIKALDSGKTNAVIEVNGQPKSYVIAANVIVKNADGTYGSKDDLAVGQKVNFQQAEGASGAITYIEIVQ